MSDQSAQAKRGTIKDPSEWTTGEEPMTAAQESYLSTIAREAGEELPPDLTIFFPAPGGAGIPAAAVAPTLPRSKSGEKT